MSLPVFKHPKALNDLEHYALYIGRDNPEAAFRFLEAAERTFAVIGTTPFIGPATRFRDKRLRGLRSWRVAGFANYLIFYQVDADCIRIVRVIHGAMNLEQELL